MRYFIGIDIGTSGTKCLMTDTAGRVVASSTHGYPLYTPRAGWAEQNPEDWWQAVIQGLRTVMQTSNVCAGDIAGVSYSGQMHGLVALDAADNVIRPAILWCDQRTQKQCDWLTEQAGGAEKLLTYTNNRMLTGYTGGKIIWLREEEPENFARMRIFLCPKDYIRFRMTGERMMDVSDASGTGFFDTKNRKWSDVLIALAGLDKAIFPQTVESTALAGHVTKQVAEQTGLPEGLPCYAGGGDAVVQAVGSGLVKPGILGVVIGTAGNVSTVFDRYEENPHGDLQMFCGNEAGMYTGLGCTQSAGGSYRWYRDALFENAVAEAEASGKNVYDIMDGYAAASVPGANGVVFTPYLAGERCPYPDANAKGCFYGINLATTRADITRAVMEGITYSLAQLVELFGTMRKNTMIYTSGGGASSALWRQMQADIFNLPVCTMSAAGEGGAYGAAMIACVGAGEKKNLAEAVEAMTAETECLPIPDNQPGYEKSYALYKRIYPSLKDVYRLGSELGY